MEDIENLSISCLKDILDNREHFQSLDLVLTPGSARNLVLTVGETPFEYTSLEDGVDYTVCLNPSCEGCPKSHDPEHTVQIVEEHGKVYLRHNGGALALRSDEQVLRFDSLRTGQTYTVDREGLNNYPYIKPGL